MKILADESVDIPVFEFLKNGGLILNTFLFSVVVHQMRMFWIMPTRNTVCYLPLIKILANWLLELKAFSWNCFVSTKRIK